MIDNTSDFYRECLTIATQAAKTAGVYQKSRWGTEFNVEFKSSINLVTEVDKASEKMIIETIRAKFPDHDILAEEDSAQRKDSNYKWIIDPLDGTTNFAHSYPMFAPSIALEHEGQIVAGAIYNPIIDEMFTAVRGGGAFLNGKPIHVSKTPSLDKALMGTGFAYNVRQAKENNFDHFQNMVMNAQGVRRDGAAAIDLAHVACGRFDGFWELNLYPWDTGAGLLLVTEAGGKVTRFDGSPYTVYDKQICATNGLFHDEVTKLLTSSNRA